MEVKELSVRLREIAREAEKIGAFDVGDELRRIARELEAEVS